MDKTLIPREALVFDIQRFSLHDGPGIRTTIFFKGCSLRCRWCQNPESLRPTPELKHLPSRCQTGCRLCESACPKGALAPWSHVPIDWNQCDHCGQCIKSCPSGALHMVGRPYSPENLADDCLVDRLYYEASNGGVTLSGGEPVLQSTFLQTFLPLLKQQGIHILLQTAGNYSLRLIEPIIPFVDAIYFDLKTANDDGYRRLTGGASTLVFDNLRWLVKQQVAISVRMPMIPSLNSDEPTLIAVARQLRDLGINKLILLPYHSLWEAKLTGLNTLQSPLHISEELNHQAIIDILQAQGVESEWTS